MAIVVCDRVGCIYNKFKRCQADIIGMGKNGCDSYIEIAKNWKEWEIEEQENLKEIDRLKSEGHSYHCACRIIWGDGECECDLYKLDCNPYRWMK